ncbi:MAG: hypothetical protein HY778_01910 [Betaproteobacteria bacterium]|nr:hypothetical protein [Betaproteobacteria bacterium]
MSGKPRHGAARRAGEAKPQTAQMEAVRRASRAGRHDEARARGRALRAAFPAFRPLHHLAWEVEREAANPMAATSRAWDWVQAVAASVPALEALRDSALAAGRAALGAWAINRLRAMDGRPPLELPPLHNPLGDLTLAQGVDMDLAQVFLNDQRYDEAIALMRHLDHPSARNNMGLAQFARGDVAAARETLEEAWQAWPGNLFALDRLMRLRLWVGGHDAAAPLAGPLAGAVPLRGEDAVAQLSGLIVLGQAQQADRAWAGHGAARFWKDSDKALRALFDYLGAVAAMALEHWDDARERSRAAMEAKPDFAAAAEARLAARLHRVPGAVDVEVGDFGSWLPVSLLHEIRRSGKDSDALVRLLGRCDATADYLGAAAQYGGAAVRAVAVAILQQRAADGDEVALAEIKALLGRPCGPDRDRSQLHHWLASRGFLARGDRVEMLVGGRLRSIMPLSVTITAEPQESDLSEADQDLLEEAVEMASLGASARALELAQQLHARLPDYPTAIGNLAAIKEGLHHPDEEVEALYRRALGIDADYVFARAGLVRVLARRGELDAARELLLPVHEREEYHFTEWRAVLMARREMARATGDRSAEEAIDDGLRDLRERFG